jgi:hypothetical protein
VTTITAFEYANKSENLTEILIDPPYDSAGNFNQRQYYRTVFLIQIIVPLYIFRVFEK